MSKSKTSTFVALLAFTLMASTLPMTAAAETCDITFSNAKVFLEDGSTAYQSITFKVEETEYTTPVTLTFTVSVLYDVQIPAIKLHDGRLYRHWTALQGINTQDGWNVVGDVDVDLVAQTGNGHLVFHIHCGGGTGTGGVEPKYARAGPAMDVMRTPVIRGPDASLIGMQAGVADVWGALTSPMDMFWQKLADVNGGLVRTGDIEKLDADGFTITGEAGFHIGHIGYNIRPLAIQQERRPELTCWPLADVNFRHALFHCYDQETIIASIYGYTVTPIYDLIPPAQGEWANPGVPTHPYNPGNPFTSPPSEHSSCGILKAAGYTFVDAGTTGVVDSHDYWECPNGDPVPKIVLWTPTYETAPTSAEHGARFVADLAEIGLAASGDNGDSGFYHEPAEFADYMDKVDHALFDAYMAFWNLDRFPDHLYDMCHSSQDVYYVPYAYNKPGINDPELDAQLETLKFSLNHTEKLDSAWDAQERLCDPEASDQALAYMALYSKIFFDAFNPDLRGIVKSPGFGAHNKWTLLNIHWALGTERYTGDGRTLINWILGEPPERLNPLYAQTTYSWAIMGPVMDGLIMVNPYTHEDVPWIAEGWEVVETATGMNITFILRKDVFWQDGIGYTAHDAKFNWEFLRDNAIPRFTSIWEFIDDVVVNDDYSVTAVVSTTSQFLLYDLAGTAAMLPPNVWAPWDGQPLEDILAYNPSTDTDPTDMGPWFGEPYGPTTHLFGTGSWIFDYFDHIGWVGQLHQFPGYFRTMDDIQNQKAEMFHQAGDVNYDGTIDVFDLMHACIAFGCAPVDDPETPWDESENWNPDTDINYDGQTDICDLSTITWYYGDLRTHPGGGAESEGSSSQSEKGEVFELTAGGGSQVAKPTVCVDPPETLNFTLKTNDSFSINVTIANATDLTGYQFGLTFDPSIMNAVSVTPGDFFSAIVVGQNKINNDVGFVRFAASKEQDPGARSGVSGSGILATINFTVQGYGNSSERLKGFTKLAKLHGIGVEHLTLNGYFDNRNPGDITGPGGIPDKRVDIWDLTLVGYAYGAFAGEPRYEEYPQADINKDDFIDIGDITIVCLNWNWIWETAP